MKDLLLRACVVVRTSNMKISRRRLADYVQTLHQKACRTCSTIIFLHSTNQIIDLWRCRCRRQILNSLKQVISRRRKNENIFKMSNDEKCTCKACKNCLCQICKCVGFLLPSSWLLKLPNDSAQQMI